MKFRKVCTAMGGLLTMYALRSIWDFLFKLEVLIHFRHVLIFRTGFSIKKSNSSPKRQVFEGGTTLILKVQLRMEVLTAK